MYAINLNSNALEIDFYYVQTRGGDVALIFNNGWALRAAVSQRSYFIFALRETVAKDVLECAALVLEDTIGNVLLLVDQADEQSNLLFMAQLSWDSCHGPDLLTEESQFQKNIVDQLSTRSDYLRQVTLFEAMLDQCLFNGFGPLLVNEILQRLYYYFGKY